MSKIFHFHPQNTENIYDEMFVNKTKILNWIWNQACTYLFSISSQTGMSDERKDHGGQVHGYDGTENYSSSESVWNECPDAIN